MMSAIDCEILEIKAARERTNARDVLRRETEEQERLRYLESVEKNRDKNEQRLEEEKAEGERWANIRSEQLQKYAEIKNEFNQKMRQECDVTMDEIGEFRLYQAHHCHRTFTNGCRSNVCRDEHRNPSPSVSDEWYERMTRATEIQNEFYARTGEACKIPVVICD